MKLLELTFLSQEPEAKFLVPDGGSRLWHGIGLSTISPSHRLRI